MGSRDLYKRFANLCQKWPLDQSKPGRDYGEFFRTQIGQHFPHGELGQVEHPKAAEAAISSLERIANNSYCSENPLKRSSASGLEAWACADAISNDGIRYIQEDGEQTLLYRLKSRLSVRFSNSKSDYKLNEEMKQIEGKPDKKNKKGD